jgi:protein TonB
LSGWISTSWRFLIISLALHGIIGWTVFTAPWPESSSVPKIIIVQIVEEKKEKAPPAQLPSPPKPKRNPKTVPPEPPPQPAVPPKEEVPPYPPIFQAAEQRIPQVLPVSEEQIGAEEKPKEEWIKEVEPGHWGIPDGPREAEPLLLAKEEPAMSLTSHSGSAQKGIPGGLAAINPWGTSSGAEAGYSAGGEGGKGTVSPKGSRMGSVYFQGEGKGRGDLGSYLGSARMRIEKAKRYPREARRKGLEGKVVLSFQINRKGEAGEIKLIQSSGYSELDEEGMATLRRASPFPSPLLIEKEKLMLEVPILFKLEQRK